MSEERFNCEQTRLQLRDGAPTMPTDRITVKDKAAADRAIYNARCEKWAGLMEEVSAEMKGQEYLPEYRRIGKRNVLKMAKTAFPEVRFSVSYVCGWMKGYCLKWKNGPTVEEVKEAGDFELFASWWDTTEMGYADIKQAQFTDFSDKFGGVGNGVKFKRVECEKDLNSNLSERHE